jgi:Xaa-Pro dipeptidase
MPLDIQQRQREAMARRGLDALAIIAPENVCWTSGVAVPSQRIVRHRHAIVLVPREGDPEMIVVDIEEGLVRAAADIPRVTAYNEFTESPMRVLADTIRARGIRGRIGVEAGYLSYQDYVGLAQALEGIARLEPIDDFLSELRMRKTPEEIAKLTRAGRIAERVAYEALRAWRKGMTEADLGRCITDIFARAGGEKLTMLSVTAGERTPLLNGAPTRREIRRGEVVRIDVIGTIENYYCDVARTAVAGEATGDLEGIWKKLVDCRDMALELIRPSASTHAVFAAYAEKMDAWGLPTINFLGHGLGLTLHEEPYMNRYTDCVLQEGMVLSIEPLVTFPELGMQLEEAVVVVRDGCEVITDQYETRTLWRMEEGKGA